MSLLPIPWKNRLIQNYFKMLTDYIIVIIAIVTIHASLSIESHISAGSSSLSLAGLVTSDPSSQFLSSKSSCLLLCCHGWITATLYSSSVRSHLDYQIVTLCYRYPRGLTPPYLSEVLTANHPSRSLLSSVPLIRW